METVKIPLEAISIKIIRVAAGETEATGDQDQDESGSVSRQRYLLCRIFPLADSRLASYGWRVGGAAPNERNPRGATPSTRRRSRARAAAAQGPVKREEG